MNLIARMFAEAGHIFVKFNFSHGGTTVEDPETFVDLEAYGNDNYLKRQADLQSMIDFVVDAFGGNALKIYLIGHSRGGTDAILYAAKDKRINALISWAAVSEAKTPWRSWDAELLKEWKENGVRYLKNGRTGQDLPIYYQLFEEFEKASAALDIERAARSMQVPWLIVHGLEDESVFIKDAYTLKSWQPEAQVLIIPRTGHTFGRQHPWEAGHLPEASMQLVAGSLKFLDSF